VGRERLESEGSALVSKLALARISEDLMTDPVAREQFIEDPIAWVQQSYKLDPSPSDRDFLRGYQQLMADGNCCGGCNCGPQGSGCSGPQGSACLLR
jgi:hypothetical protein